MEETGARVEEEGKESEEKKDEQEGRGEKEGGLKMKLFNKFVQIIK